MSRNYRLPIAIAVAFAFTFTAGLAYAQQSQTKSTEVKRFTIIAVDGNKVVIRDTAGTREITVPPDFALTVDGKPVTVADLKPGMAGTATITTTTTTTPVTVTEVKNGEVMQASGNSLMVKTPQGIRMFSPGDIEKRGVKIMKDGKEVDFSGLHAGDRLTATIITEKPPQVLTEQQVAAAMSSAPGGAGATGGAPGAKAGTGAAAKPAPAAPPPPPAGAASSGGKKLPKTASDLPLLGVAGAAFLALGIGLTALRRRRTA
jgi:LPXTG-motif cell wall-anchored protein